MINPRIDRLDKVTRNSVSPPKEEIDPRRPTVRLGSPSSRWVAEVVKTGAGKDEPALAIHAPASGTSNR